MQQRCGPSLALFAFLFVTVPVQSKPLYRLIDLGTLGASTNNESRAYAINNDCQVVGYSRRSATLFDITGDGKNTNIGSLIGRTGSIAYGINNQGMAVGVYDVDYPEGGYLAAYFDIKSANAITLESGGYRAKAYAINDSNYAAGFAYPGDPREYSPIATVFDATHHRKVYLGIIEGGYRSIANAINDLNQVVGEVNVYGSGDHAVLFDFTGGGKNISLGHGIAYDINNRSQIVGVSDDKMATLFGIESDSNNLSLGALPVYNHSEAYAINNHGEIVGRASRSEELPGRDSMRLHLQAVMFDSTGNGNNVNLNEVIDPNSGWDLIEAKDINDRGWIVCNGRNNSSHLMHAILLVPLVEADFNRDGIVNLDDFARLAQHWRSMTNNHDDSCLYDISPDRDSTINYDDVSAFSEAWLN